MNKIVGIFADSMRAGKSTVTEEFIKIGYKPLKFAGILKKMLVVFLEENGVESPWDYIEGDKRNIYIPNINVTARKLMQTLGTEWGRDCIFDDIWVNSVINKIHADKGTKYVIDDLRFNNEYTALQGIGAWFIKVEREIYTVEHTNHRSEGELYGAKAHFTIHNNRELSDLQKSAKIVAYYIDKAGEAHTPTNFQEI